MKRNVRLRVCGDSIWTHLSIHRIALNPVELILDLNGLWVLLTTLCTSPAPLKKRTARKADMGLKGWKSQEQHWWDNTYTPRCFKDKANHTSFLLSFSFKNYSFSSHRFPSFHENPECKNKFLKNAIYMMFSDTWIIRWRTLSSLFFFFKSKCWHQILLFGLQMICLQYCPI